MTNKICLNMIVKNESKIIIDSLKTMVNWIDYYVICDTGSTDGTQDIIKNFFDKHGIKGKLVQHQWKNFGHNRNLALKEVKKLDSSINIDYILLCDADMHLVVLDETWKSQLIYDQIMVQQRSEALAYDNVRLVNNKCEHKYICPTHEYITCLKKNSTGGKLQSIYFIDHANGENRKDKFVRDAKILTEALKDDPTNCRYMFYLAQSYMDNGDNDDAIKWYKKRITAGGWIEEIYYSYYKLGLLYKRKNYKWSKIENAFINAYKYLPKRAEPFYEISEHYKDICDYKNCYKYAKKAMNIPYPTNLSLFISKSVYDYKAMDNAAISCYYINKHKEAIKLNKKILKVPTFPQNQIPRIEKNMQFSIDALKKTNTNDISSDSDNDSDDSIFVDNTWISIFEAGKKYLQKNDVKNGQYYLLKAYDMNPTKLEPLLQIATYFRIEGNNHLSIIYSKHGLKICNQNLCRILNISNNFAVDLLLNVNLNNRLYKLNKEQATNEIIYYLNLKLKFSYEISISTYYTKEKKLGCFTCHYILEKHNRDLSPVSNDIILSTRRNQLFYLQILDEIDGVQVSTPTKSLINIHNPKNKYKNAKYNTSNPCICTDGTDVWINIRHVNFIGANYESMSQDNKIKTRNIFGKLNTKTLMLSDEKYEIKDYTKWKKKQNGNVIGFEDIRMFYKNGWHFLSTSYDARMGINGDNNPMVVLGNLNNIPNNKDEWETKSVIPLYGNMIQLCEKNWLPILQEVQTESQPLQILYSTFPLHIVEYNEKNKQVRTIKKIDWSKIIGDFRGSSPLIPWCYNNNHGWLYLIHEVYFDENLKRTYKHRFVWLSQNMNKLRYSEPFFFEHSGGIEYCAGCVYLKDDNRVLVSYGYEDRVAKVMSLNSNYVSGLLTEELDEKKIVTTSKRSNKKMYNIL